MEEAGGSSRRLHVSHQAVGEKLLLFTLSNQHGVACDWLVCGWTRGSGPALPDRIRGLCPRAVGGASQGSFLGTLKIHEQRFPYETRAP